MQSTFPLRLLGLFGLLSLCLLAISPTGLHAQDAAGKIDFTRLSQPLVASQLGLSDEQRAKVAELLNQRILELAAAPAEQRAPIRTSNNALLKALLTPEQLTRFEELVTGGMLRFNFRGETWVNVLDWFARQAELSLVMDESPPGKFTYSDQKDYTPTQAIDLLNSVLLGKQFTLVRRERMLIVVNLADGIPFDLIPQVAVEDLPKRGKFEWVTVKFPLGARPIEAVVSEVKPILSPLGSATPLVASKKLLVTETAGKMEAINLLISAVPEVIPPKPKPKPKPTPPPPKVFVTYPLKGINIPETVETITKLFGTRNIVGDAAAEQIQVYATEADQALIKKALDKITENASNQLKTVTQAHSVSPDSGLTLEQVQTQITSLFPEAQVTADDTNSRLIVIANNKTQQLIDDTLKTLGAGDTVQADEKQVVVYTVSEAQVETAVTLLTSLLPRSQVIGQGTRIAIRGDSTDQATAELLIEKLNSDVASAKAEIRFYDLANYEPSYLETLQNVAPNGTLAWLPERQKLSVIADSTEHELLTQAIEQINSQLVPLKRSLKILPVTSAQKSRFAELQESIAEEFATAKIITDANPREFAVWGTERQHESIKAILESLKVAAPTSAQFQRIPVQVAEPEQLLALLEKQYPEKSIILSPSSDAILVQLTPDETAAFQKAVDDISAVLPQSENPSLEVYTLKQPLAEIQPMLTPMVPDATLTADETNNRLIVWTTQSGHEKLQAALEKLDVAPDNEQQLEVFELKGLDAAVAQSLLEKVKGKASVTVAASGKSLLIWGTTAEQQKIREVLTQAKPLTADSKTELQLYPVRPREANRILTTIQSVLPSADVSLDSDSARVIAIADKETHQQIAALISKLSPDEDSSPRVLVAYPLENADPEVIVPLLQELHPRIGFTAEPRSGRVLVTAPLVDQPRMKGVIAQLDAKASGRSKSNLKSYSLEGLSGEMITEIVTPLFSEMRLSRDEKTNRLYAWGTGDEQEKLTGLIEQLQSETQAEQTLQSYPIGQTPPADVINVLTQAVPTAIFSANATERKIVAWGTKNQHQLIATAVAQLTGDVAEMSVKSYMLDFAVPAQFAEMMQSLYPNVRISISPDGLQLIVWANEKQHTVVASAVEELKSGRTKRKGLQLKVYSAEPEVIAAASPVANDLAPQARIVPQPDDRKLLIWASAEEHEAILKAFEKLKQEIAPTKDEQSIRLFPLNKVTRTTASELIARDFPKALILDSSDDQKLIIRSDQPTLEAIAKLMAELDTTFQGLGTLTIKVYPVRSDLKSEIQTVAANLLPNISFVTNNDPERILANASPDDHQSLQKLIELLKSQVAAPEKRMVKAYALKSVSEALANDVVSNRFPAISVIPDSDSKRILFWATAGEHAEIPKVLETLEETISNDVKQLVRVVSVDPKKLTATSVLDLIDPALKTDASFQIAADSNSLVIRGPKEKLDQLEQAIQDITTQIPEPLNPTTVVYDLASALGTQAAELIAPVAPNATLSVTDNGKRLAATANPTDHQLIKSVIEQLDKVRAGADITTRVYQLEQSVPSVIRSAIAAMSPTSEVTADDPSRSLIVSATDADHKRISAVLLKLNEPGGNRRTEVFTLELAEPTSLLPVIGALLPEASVAADTNTNSLVVTARPADFAEIEAIVKKLDAVSQAKIGDVVAKVYPFEKNVVDAVDMKDVIDPELAQGMSLRVNEIGNSLIIRTTEAKHAQLKVIFDEVVSQVPAERLTTTKVYALGSIDPDAIESVLSGVFARGEFAVDSNTRTIVATLSEKEHQQIDSVLKQMAAGNVVGPTETRAFRMKRATASVVGTGLESLLPNAIVSVDDNANSVIVTGTPDELKSAAELVDQIDGGKKDQVTQVYRLTEADPRFVAPAIEELLPDATVTSDRYSKSLFITATKEEQAEAAKMVEQLNEDQRGVVTEVYRLKTADARYVALAVQDVLPNASVSGDRLSKSLFVTATPEEQKQAAEVVKKLNDEQQGLVTEVYRLTTADARYVALAVQDVLPNASVSGDRLSKSLFVTATKEEQQQAENLVEKLNGKQEGVETEVYRLSTADPRYVAPAVQELLPGAMVSSDRFSKSLFVTGTKEEQAQAAKMVEKLNGTAGEQVVQIYPLKNLESASAEAAVQQLVPNGSVSADRLSNALVVSASESEQAAVGEMIARLDAASSTDPVLKVYTSRFENTDPLMATLQNVFRDDETVRLNHDWEAQRIYAVATEAQHKMIRELVDQVDVAKPTYADRFPRVYQITNLDAANAESILRNVYGEEKPRLETRTQKESNTLIVVATATQHEQVRKSLEEIDGDLRNLEVFQLYTLDPFSIELAINALFEDLPENLMPAVTSDIDSQQLFVRGSEAQIQQIRSLLQKMGESVAADTKLSSGGVRTIPFRGNAVDAIREIEAIWPRVRKNRIQVIRPGKNKIRREINPRDFSNEGAESKVLPEDIPRLDTKQKKRSLKPRGLDRGGCDDFGECGDLGDSDDLGDDDDLGVFQTSGKSDEDLVGRQAGQDPNQDPDGSATSPQATQSGNSRPPAQSNSTTRGPETRAGKTGSATGQQQEGADIVIIPGENEITIASSDLEALDQLETLLRTLQRAGSGGIGSSNFAVFLLSNSNAKDTARLLTELFAAIPAGERAGSVGDAVFVADNRLNAMVVYGTRKEREVIQEIIEVLDAEDLPDSLTTPVPELVTVSNTSASRLLSILQSVYQTQLSSGGGRKEVDIPEGVSSTVASVLQQINAASAGPILTLGVDEVTNSIVLRAPTELATEIKDFISRLDQNAVKVPTRGVRVLRLEQSNTARLRRFLEEIAGGTLPNQ